MNSSIPGSRSDRPSPADALPSSRGRMEGLNAFVTGASRGIGRAIALAFAKEGANLCLAATNRSALDETASMCAASGGGSQHVEVLDVKSRSQCFDAIKRSRARLGEVDVLVNSSGVFRPKSFLEYEPEDFQEMLAVNLYGVIHLMQAVLPGMIGQKSGKIINIASTGGKWASSNQSAYNVSKHAVVGLTRCTALEMASHGICINAICPGLVQTDMMNEGFGRTAQAQNLTLDEVLAPVLSRVAMRRVLQPDEISGLAVYLASNESSGMTGQSLLLDGGMLYV